MTKSSSREENFSRKRCRIIIFCLFISNTDICDYVINLLNVSEDCYMVLVPNHLSSGLHSQGWGHTQVRCYCY